MRHLTLTLALSLLVCIGCAKDDKAITPQSPIEEPKGGGGSGGSGAGNASSGSFSANAKAHLDELEKMGLTLIANGDILTVKMLDASIDSGDERNGRRIHLTWIEKDLTRLKDISKILEKISTISSSASDKILIESAPKLKRSIDNRIELLEGFKKETSADDDFGVY